MLLAVPHSWSMSGVESSVLFSSRRSFGSSVRDVPRVFIAGPRLGLGVFRDYGGARASLDFVVGCFLIALVEGSCSLCVWWRAGCVRLLFAPFLEVRVGRNWFDVALVSRLCSVWFPLVLVSTCLRGRDQVPDLASTSSTSEGGIRFPTSHRQGLRRREGSGSRPHTNEGFFGGRETGSRPRTDEGFFGGRETGS